jgi:hypothetical protein
VTLIDPRDAFADQSSFVSYLVGLVGLRQAVYVLAADGYRRASSPCDADDLVHLLLGVASLAEAIENLAESELAQRKRPSAAPQLSPASTRWLR